MTAGGVARTPAALTVEVEYTVARLAASTVEAAAPWARWRQVHAATLPVSGRILDCMEDCHTGALRQTGSDSEVGQRGWKEALSGVKGYQQHASTRDEDLLRPQLEDSSSLQQKRRFRRRFKVMDGLQRGGWNEWKRVRSKDKALTQSFGLAKGFARVYGARTGRPTSDEVWQNRRHPGKHGSPRAKSDPSSREVAVAPLLSTSAKRRDSRAGMSTNQRQPDKIGQRSWEGGGRADPQCWRKVLAASMREPTNINQNQNRHATGRPKGPMQCSSLGHDVECTKGIDAEPAQAVARRSNARWRRKTTRDGPRAECTHKHIYTFIQRNTHIHVCVCVYTPSKC